MAIDKRLFGLYSLNFFINAANSILAPFYPDEAIAKGVSKDVIGLIFSSDPLASFFFSLALGKMMNKWGRRKLLTIGLFLQSFGLAAFGAVIHSPSQSVFIAISIIARVFQGLGLSAYLAIAYAYIPLLYPTSVEQKIGIMEMLTGVGLMLGPLIGGLLFELGGYQTPFYSMAALFFVVIPLIWNNLPPDNSSSPNFSPLLEDEIPKKDKKTLSLIKFLTNRQIICMFIVVILPNCGLCFLQPTLSSHLHSFTSSTLLISAIFSVGTIFYALFMPIISVLPKSIDRRLWIILGTLLVTLSSFLLGPEPVLNLPFSIAWPIFSLSILGTGCAICLLPAIPEFIELGVALVGEGEKEKVGDMASGLFNSAYSAGSFIGPILGGALDERFGFPRAESIMGLIDFGGLAVYLSVGGAGMALLMRKKKRGDTCSQTMGTERVMEDEREVKAKTEDEEGETKRIDTKY